MQKISQGTFERAKMSSLAESRCCSYGNSLFLQSIAMELVTLNGIGYICCYDSTLCNRDDSYGYSYYKGPASDAEAEYKAFEEYAAEYFEANYPVAGGF